MVPSPFRYTLKIGGTGEYALRLSTEGWIEGVEATGLGAGEDYAIEENGRRLVLRLRPRAGSLSVVFGLRPMGVRVPARRDAGRPPPRTGRRVDRRRTQRIRRPCRSRLPDTDTEGRNINTEHLLHPRPPTSRVQLWLSPRVRPSGSRAGQRSQSA
jgi:hypothetical protein